MNARAQRAPLNPHAQGTLRERLRGAHAAVDRQNCADEPADGLRRLHDFSADFAYEIGGDVDAQRRAQYRQHGRKRRYDRAPLPRSTRRY